MTHWNLYLDDLRNPETTYGTTAGPLWTVARSTEEAIQLVKEKGMPALMSLDHDLGETDRAMDFLKWLANEYWQEGMNVPDYHVHSANPVGSLNLASFMNSWVRSLELA